MKWAPPCSSFWDTREDYGILFFLYSVILSEMYSGYLKCMSCNLWQHKQSQSRLDWNYKDGGDGRDTRAWLMQLAASISAYTAFISACTLRLHPSREKSWLCFYSTLEEDILKKIALDLLVFILCISVFYLHACVHHVWVVPLESQRGHQIPMNWSYGQRTFLIAQRKCFTWKHWRWQNLYANIFRNLY